MDEGQDARSSRHAPHGGGASESGEAGWGEGAGQREGAVLRTGKEKRRREAKGLAQVGRQK